MYGGIMKKIFVLFFLFAFQLWADEIYFPPIDGKSWETISL